jgi:hypothetical protein
VLIVFKDKYSLDAYFNYLKSSNDANIANYQLLTEENAGSVENINEMVRKATRSRQVTLLVREFGRGTDFICNDKTVKENGGVAVI